MFEIWAREIDSDTDNACWVICNKVDFGAISFVPRIYVDTIEDRNRKIDIENSWRVEVDRQGGAFTDEEINRTGML